MNRINGKCVTEHQIASYEVDRTAKTKLSTVFQLFQDMASEDAASAAFGFDAMAEKRLVWVISKIYIVIDRMPAWREKTRMSTWPNGAEKLYGYRDFTMENEQGDVIIRGTSSWLILDREKRRPVIVPDHIPDTYDIVDEHTLSRKANKLTPPKDGEIAQTYSVQYEDIDMNQHVSNTRYVDWCINALDYEYLMHHTPTSIEINYTGELYMGDTVEIHKQRLEDNRFLFAGYAKEKPTPSFIAEIAFAAAE